MRKPRPTRNAALAIAWLAAGAVQAADVQRTEANDGNLIMEDVPAIPQQLVLDLNRYQNVRAAQFLDWAGDASSRPDRDGSRGIYIATRFGDVDQVHRVDMPGGARRQLTFSEDPIDEVKGQPGGDRLVFTRDAGGNEFSQIFLMNPEDGSAEMLTDGESRNGAIVWDREGEKCAYQSTRRNGASNDVWMMNPAEPAASEMILASPDGTWWGPVDFSDNGASLLIQNYVSIADARVHLLDLDSGNSSLLAFATPELIHYPTFDEVDGEARQIPAWVYRPRSDGPVPVIISIHGGPEGQARPYFNSTFQM